MDCFRFNSFIMCIYGVDSLNSKEWWRLVNQLQKPDPKQEKKYCTWLRKFPCVTCRGGDWDREKGEFHNTVSHIKTKGSGGEIFNNTVPMCFFHHRKWEDSIKSDKDNMLRLAQEYYQRWLDENME